MLICGRGRHGGHNLPTALRMVGININNLIWNDMWDKEDTKAFIAFLDWFLLIFLGLWAIDTLLRMAGISI